MRAAPSRRSRAASAKATSTPPAPAPTTTTRAASRARAAASISSIRRTNSPMGRVGIACSWTPRRPSPATVEPTSKDTVS